MSQLERSEPWRKTGRVSRCQKKEIGNEIGLHKTTTRYEYTRGRARVCDTALFSAARAQSCGAAIFHSLDPSPNLDRETLELWRQGQLGSDFQVLWQTDFHLSKTP